MFTEAIYFTFLLSAYPMLSDYLQNAANPGEISRGFDEHVWFAKFSTCRGTP